MLFCKYVIYKKLPGSLCNIIRLYKNGNELVTNDKIRFVFVLCLCVFKERSFITKFVVEQLWYYVSLNLE